MEITKINEILIDHFNKRGFIKMDKETNTPKLDGHYYYTSEPLSLARSVRLNSTELKVRLKVYHKKQDVFVSYGAKYTLVPSKEDFVERHAFSYEYLYILKMIRSILEDTGIISQLKLDLKKADH